jgi:hypothetical protein
VPIQYQPAAPVGLAVQAGRGSAATKNNAILADVIRESIQAASEGSRNVTQAGIAQMETAERARQFDIGQQAESARMAYRVGAEQMQQQAAMMAQQEMMRQRFEQTKQMQFLEFTLEDQKEQLKLRRAMSWIDQGEREGRFLPEEAFAMRGKVVAGLDHYAAKAANARIAQDEAQTQALQAKNKLFADIELQRQNYMVGNVDKLPLVTDPTTGQQRRMMLNHNGELYDPFAKAGGDKAVSQKQVFDLWSAADKAVNEQIDADIKMRRSIMEAEAKSTGKNPTAAPSTWEDPTVRQGVYEHLMRRRGFSPNFMEYQRQMTRQGDQQQEPGSQAPQPAGPAGDMGRRPGMMGSVSNADKPVAGMEQPTTPVGKPFNPAEPDYFEKLDTRQKSVMVNINKFAGMIDDPRLTPEEKAAAKIYLDTAKGLYATYGDTRQMGDNARVFADAVKNLGDIEMALLRREKPNPGPQSSQEGYQRLRFK